MTSPLAKPMIVGSPALVLLGATVNGYRREPPADMAFRLEDLIASARLQEIPVIRIHARGGLAEDREPSETGREPVHGIDCPDYRLSKLRPSCFLGTELEILLKGLAARTLIFAGCDADVDIHYSFVDAHQRDYYARVAEDCVWGSGRAAQDYALKAMEYLQFGACRRASELAHAFSSRDASALA